LTKIIKWQLFPPLAFNLSIVSSLPLLLRTSDNRAVDPKANPTVIIKNSTMAFVDLINLLLSDYLVRMTDLITAS
jgi:hypothetical protein